MARTVLFWSGLQAKTHGIVAGTYVLAIAPRAAGITRHVARRARGACGRGVPRFLGQLIFMTQKFLGMQI